jgi:hypothetical protein
VTRTHVFIAVLIAALSTGLAAGLAAGGAGATGSTDTDTTTLPATSTTTEGTTAPVTTTAPSTTTGSTATATTTGPDTTPTTTMTMSTSTPPPGTTTNGTAPTTTASNPPVAPCDTTQITCGNNAATQIAIVSQNCNAASGPTVITVEVQTLDGKPVNNYTVNPTTTCMNILAITQIVQQFCVNCTLIVIPPPPVAPPKAPAARALYCMPQPVLRKDGTEGRMVDLEYGQPYVDPTYAGAVLASYVKGVGYTCAEDSPDDLGSHVPVFTLTVPASFIGQWINLCVQPTVATQKPKCHAIRIDSGATVTIPVTSNVAATVTSGAGGKAAKTNVKAKSHKKIKSASDAFAATQANKNSAKANKHAKKKGK